MEARAERQELDPSERLGVRGLELPLALPEGSGRLAEPPETAASVAEVDEGGRSEPVQDGSPKGGRVGEVGDNGEGDLGDQPGEPRIGGHLLLRVAEEPEGEGRRVVAPPLEGQSALLGGERDELRPENGGVRPGSLSRRAHELVQASEEPLVVGRIAGTPASAGAGTGRTVGVPEDVAEENVGFGGRELAAEQKIEVGERRMIRVERTDGSRAVQGGEGRELMEHGQRISRGLGAHAP